MKKQILLLLSITGLCLALSFTTKAQSTAASNAYASGRFLGWNATSGDLFFRTNNTDRMVLKNTTGNFGIGTTTASPPTARLDVLDVTSANTVQVLRRGPQTNGTSEDVNMNTVFGFPYLKIGGNEYRGSANSIQSIGFGYNINSIQPAEIGFLTTSTAGYTLGSIVFATRNVTTNTAPTEAMRITNAGNVLIGTSNDNVLYKLSVLGAIRCNKVVVEIGWADYVFNKEYKLMPINALEKFVSVNNHLPNIPTATEIEKNGLDLGSVQAKQMEKIEELTLYIIELNKRIAELEKWQAKK